MPPPPEVQYKGKRAGYTGVHRCLQCATAFWLQKPSSLRVCVRGGRGGEKGGRAFYYTFYFCFLFLTMCIRSHWQNSAPIRPPPPSYQSPFNPNLPHPRTQTFSPPPPPAPLPLPQRPGRSHNQLAQPCTTLGLSLTALIYPLPPPLIDPTPA